MTYIDTHGVVFVSGEALEMERKAIRDKSRDQWGVLPLNLYFNEQGRAFCVSDAPSAEAVKKSHDAIGVSCDEIVPVNSLV